MITGRVIGSVTSTINHPFYDGKKLMMVEKIDAQGKPSGDYLIAVDAIASGPGDPVLVLDEGNGARQVLNDSSAPCRSVIVGFIDAIETH